MTYLLTRLTAYRGIESVSRKPKRIVGGRTRDRPCRISARVGAKLYYEHFIRRPKTESLIANRFFVTSLRRFLNRSFFGQKFHSLRPKGGAPRYTINCNWNRSISNRSTKYEWINNGLIDWNWISMDYWNFENWLDQPVVSRGECFRLAGFRRILCKLDLQESSLVERIFDSF